MRIENNPFETASAWNRPRTNAKEQWQLFADKLQTAVTEVDDLEKQIMRELFLMVMEKPSRIEQSFLLINVARTLERAGDHVTNVAERIAYMYTGKTVRASQHRRKQEA